jgi:acetyl esterase/lipase
MKTPLPCVVLIHGGSWRFGGRDSLLLPAALLARLGFVTASIEYRLTHEAPFPAQIEDCKCAVRFLRANAAELGLDPERIGAFGTSAGGHLAALLGTAPDHPALEGNGGWPDVSSAVQAVVDWYGPTDVAALAGEALQGSVIDLLGGPVRTHLAVAAFADPATHVTPSCPPFLILHGSEDRSVPLSQSEYLHAALLGAGIDSELIVMEGKGHGFLGVRAVRKTVSFLRERLKPPVRRTGAGPE